MIEHLATDQSGDLQAPPIEPLLTLEEVADLLRVPVLTVRWLR